MTTTNQDFDNQTSTSSLEVELSRLYLEEKLSAKQIAERFGKKPREVYRLVQEFGLRKYAPYPERESKYDLEELKRLYLQESKTAAEIAEILRVTKKAVQHAVNLAGLKKQVPTSWNESKIDKTDPVFNYLMGLTATDGHIDLDAYRLSIRLLVKDRKPLDALAEYLSLSTGVRLYRHDELADLTIPSKLLIQYVETEYKITRQKTFTLETPTRFHDDDCLRMYLRGVIDGDGSLAVYPSKRGATVRLHCGADKFVDGLLEFINKRFSYDVKKSFVTVRGTKYPGFHFSGTRALEFLRWLYEGHEAFRIERKFEQFTSVHPAG